MDLPSWDSLFAIARDEILIRNPKLSRDAVERDGMDANAMTAAIAAVGDELTAQMTDVTTGLFIDSAANDPGTEKLDRLLFDRYGLLRKAAAPGLGSVVFLVPTPLVSPFSIPVGTSLQTTDGSVFLTSETGLFLAGQTSLVVAVRSSQAGSDQTASPGVITQITGAVTGAPTGLTVINTLATAGAADAESNAAFAERGRAFFTNVRRGTVAAITQAALAVPGVETAAAFESLDALGRPAGYVQLVVTDAFTDQFVDYTQTPPLYAAQSLQITEAVYAGLADARAAGIYVDVQLGVITILPVALGLTFSSSANVDLVATLARAAIVNYINALPPGSGFVYADAEAALRSVPGLAWTGYEITSPAGDVDVNPLVALRSSMTIVNTTSTQSSRPLVTSLNPDAY